jgi:aminomethyltransferase
MVPFAGWDMPVSYPIGTAAEVRACRSTAGLFDVSHMGEVSVDGAEAESFLQSLTTNDVARLAPGEAQYSMLLNDRGGVIDDIIVYRVAASQFIVVVNAGCHDKDVEWIIAHSNASDVKIADLSDQTALIAVQGPNAVAMASGLTEMPLAELKRFQFSHGKCDGDIPVLFSRTGYTGEDGFEIFCPWDSAPPIWGALSELGAIPCGLGARDVLRLEAAYPLYGHELDSSHTPYESGTGWAVKLKKGQFVGSDALLKQREAGVPTVLVGLTMTDPSNAIAREGYAVLAGDSEPVGQITSGTLSPTVGRGIAMGRVNRPNAAIGSRLNVDIRGRSVGADVTKLPFYRNGV